MNTNILENLHQEVPAIYVDGIGAIGQYNSYWDNYWQSGTAYFVRDMYRISMETYPDDPHLRQRFDRINSKIYQWENEQAHELAKTASFTADEQCAARELGGRSGGERRMECAEEDMQSKET
jgi:hypothetical protein